MNRDIYIDLVKLCKLKIFYKTYSKIRIALGTYFCRKFNKIQNPTIFTFNLDDDCQLNLTNFLRKGSCVIFWENQSSQNHGVIEKYVAVANNPVSLTHNYKEGEYKILIFAEDKYTTFSSSSFNNTCRNIVSFIKIGQGFIDLSRFFYCCTRINIILNHLDFSNVNNTYAMFYGARLFNQPIGDWDVSNVTDMGSMFSGAESFNNQVNDWDVSNVTHMSYMFENARAFNQPVGDWDVSNVTDMESMFESAKSFNQPVGNWNVSSVNNMMFMFEYASTFNQSIESWNVSNVDDSTGIFNEGLPSYESTTNG